MSPEGSDDAVVYIVDDNPDVREGIKSLLESVGLKAEVFVYAVEFAQSRRNNRVSCLILDIWLPGLTLLWQIAFMPHAVERSSAVRTSLQWLRDEIHDGVTYGRQAWLRWRTVDSFFPAS